MPSTTTRSFVRHSADQDSAFLAAQEAAATERREALEARQEALRASDPALAAWVAKRGRRGR